MQVTICPPHCPDTNGFVEHYNRTFEYECLRVHRPADELTTRTVTDAFRQHYNHERPNQALSCGNQPPAVAFADLAPRPPLPTTVDPDRWLDVLKRTEHDPATPPPVTVPRSPRFGAVVAARYLVLA